jgi:hypothetical protein
MRDLNTARVVRTLADVPNYTRYRYIHSGRTWLLTNKWNSDLTGSPCEARTFYHYDEVGYNIINSAMLRSKDLAHMITVTNREAYT